MAFLAELWLPILLAAVAVFVVSSVVHMVIPIHRSDHAKLPDEDAVGAVLRATGAGPGSYHFPHCTDMKEMGTPEHLGKMQEGPVGFLTLLPNGPPAIGKSLVQWFLHSLLIGVFVAYVARMGVADGADFARVFRVTTACAFLGYGLGVVPESIWKGASWTTTAKFLFDGLLYALATGATFGWLWPAA